MRWRSYFGENRARLELIASKPERILNECAKQDIPVTGAVRTEGGLRITVPVRDVRRLRASLCGGEKILSLRISGPARLLRPGSGRRALLGCLFVCLATVWSLSLFLWRIDVRGNETVDTAEILRALEPFGVRVGAFRFAVRQEDLENAILLAIPDLSWVSVNPRGSSVTVLVREMRRAPDPVDEGAAVSLAASREGVVVRVTALRGRTCVSPGDAVESGQILIASDVDSLHSGVRTERAMGEVWAQTLRVLTAVSPLSASETRQDGPETDRWALLPGIGRWNFYFDSRNPAGECVTIRREIRAALPGGVELPLALLHETVRGVTETPARRDAEALCAALEEVLSARLSEELAGGGEILRTEIETDVSGGRAAVTLTAVCLEQIAQEVPAS